MTTRMPFSTKIIPRPLQSITIPQQLLFFIALLALSIGLRILWPELRPLHHDEGVNFYFFEQVGRSGLYQYSHENYHGPLYFYLAAFFQSLFGDSILTIRFASILTGAMACVLPIAIFYRRISSFVLVVASLTLTFSSSTVFFSRYAIHESLLLFSFLLMASAAGIFFHEKKSIVTWGGIATISASLCFATKETTVILGTANLLALLLLTTPRHFMHRLGQLIHGGGWWILLSVFILILLFTGGFQWSSGMREFFLAFSQWMMRGTADIGHFKPWYYYINLLWRTEPTLLICVVFPVIARTILAKQIFGARLWHITYFSLLGTLVLVVQSCIPYKMPWLGLQISGPLSLSLGIAIGTLVEYLIRNKALSFIRKVVLIILVSIPVPLQFLSMVRFNFLIPYGAQNPFSYVHTTSGMLDLTQRIIPYLSENPSTKVLVGVHSYWPLPYYLRKFARQQVDYQHFKEGMSLLAEYPLAIVDHERKQDLLENPCLQLEYYRLSDAQECYLVINSCRLDKQK